MHASPSNLSRPSSRLGHWIRHLLGLVISSACIAFIAWHIDLNEFLKAIAIFKWPWLVFGFAALTLGYCMRILRWALLLRAAGAPVAPGRCAAPFLGSIALNNVLPMRLGDVVRALVFPQSLGIGKLTATGSLLMERLVDLLTLLIALAVGLAFSAITQPPAWLPGMAVSLAIMGGAGLLAVFLFSGPLARWMGRLAEQSATARRQRILSALKTLLSGFEAMSRPWILAGLFGLSAAVWAGESGLFWALLQGFGFNAAPSIGIMVMAIATLSTLVPSSPGYVGPFHIAAYAAVSMLGGTPEQAASYAVLAHLGVWAPTTVAGALAILFNPQLFGRAKLESLSSPPIS